MKFGLITKVAVTPANAPDGKALKYICPKEGVVFDDKGYFSKEASLIMKQSGCVSKAILKNNMRGKDFEKDRRYSQNKEYFMKGYFRWQCKRARYMGIAKNQFQGIMQALTHNFKRLIRVQNAIFLTGLNRPP